MRMVGKVGQGGGTPPWLNEADVRKCVLSSKITF